MSETSLRVVIDVNLFISYLLPPIDRGRTIVRIVEQCARGTFTLLLPQKIIGEMLETIAAKPDLRDRIDQRDTIELLTSLEGIAEIVPDIPEPFPAIVRDAKDDYLLAYAMVGNADLLVTGDDDLLVLAERITDFQIVTPARFLVMLET